MFAAVLCVPNDDGVRMVLVTSTARVILTFEDPDTWKKKSSLCRQLSGFGRTVVKGSVAWGRSDTPAHGRVQCFTP